MEKGQIIQDRYELASEIGKGGMATVWLARDLRLDRQVAIKFLAGRLAEDPEFLVRFFAEAQSVARISHPNVVSILDFGESEELPYLVMEHVSGGSAADFTKEPMEPAAALGIVAQAAQGVGAAHRIGLVHRDIKPANILLDESGNAKLADFGISSAQASERLTATGTAIGSPHYISPEQVAGDAASPASDVYSLGVVLYELLTAQRPFEAENVTAIAIAHVDQQPEPPSSHVEGLDPAIDALVMRCLAKDPSDRLSDGSALAAAIGGIQSAEPPTEDATDVLAVPFVRSGHRPSAMVATLIVLLLLGVTGAVVLASAGSEAPAEATTERPSPGPTKKARKSPSPSASAAAPVSVPSSSPSPEAEEETEDGTDKNDKPDKDPKDPPEEEEPEPEPSPTPDDPQPSPQPSEPADEG